MTKRRLPAAPAFQKPERLSFKLHQDVATRWDPDVRLSSEQEADNTISILDQIGYDYWDGGGVTAKRIAAALRKIGHDQDVTVVINSPGGDYFEGLAIYNLLREHKGKVTAKIIGVAASAASVIAMAADEIQIGMAAFFMIHNASVLVYGNRNDMRSIADWLEPFDQTAVDIYEARTGASVDKLKAWLDEEKWIGGKEAVALGFADDTLDSSKVAKTDTSPSQSAQRKIDLLLAMQNVPRSQRRQLIQDLRGTPESEPQTQMASKPSATATTTDTPSAVDLSAAIQAAKQIQTQLRG